MTVSAPTSPGALAEQLRFASQAGHKISLIGNNSKRLAAGPISPFDLQITTRALNRVLAHERNDLTISVESGMRFCELQKFLRAHEQMIALDPPFSEDCSVGGVLATDFSGPLRRKFGTARDQVIGMSFAKLDGSLVSAGGMVVKNVAGLDLAKLLIGSFGTLAAITSVNFRVHTVPKHIVTFLLSFSSVEKALERRNEILQSALSPWTLELFSPLAAARVGRRRVLLAIRAAGSDAVVQRYRTELRPDDELVGEDELSFWRITSNFASDFLSRNSEGIVVRLGTPLADISAVFKSGSGAFLSHAGSGVTDAFFTSWEAVEPLWTMAKAKEWSAVVAFSPPQVREDEKLWLHSDHPETSNGFAMMGRLKGMFDSASLLNASRLYGYI